MCGSVDAPNGLTSYMEDDDEKAANRDTDVP